MNQDQLNEDLFQACMFGHLDKAKELIEAGANIEATNENGWTPLHWAACNLNLELFKFLIKEGANPKATTDYGCTPLNVIENQIPYIKYHLPKFEQAIKEAA